MAGDGADDRWTLRAADRARLGNKSSNTRLGFAILLKLFQAEERFPRRPEDVPLAAVEAVAAQVGVRVAAWRGYDWHGRAIRYHASRAVPRFLSRGHGRGRNGPGPLADRPGARPGNAGKTGCWPRRASAAVH